MKYFDDMPLRQPRLSRPFTLNEADSIEFARQWDPQPFHIDKAFAATTDLGLIASGVHTVAIAIRLSNDLADEPYAVIAGLGWDKIRFLAPVRPGDVLRVRMQVVDKRLSQSRPGTGIAVSLLELLNQDDTVVMTLENSALVRCRPA